MPTSDFPDFWTITGICLDLFPWPLVVMSLGTMTTSYFEYVGDSCHTTSTLWEGVSGGIYFVYGSPSSLYGIGLCAECLLVLCWKIEVLSSN